MQKQNGKRKPPLKNYFILLVLACVTIVATIYITKWIRLYKDNKLGTSPLEGVISKVNINEVNMVLAEENKVILYVGYNNDSEINKIEKKLATEINKKEYNNYVYYVDITEYINNNKYLTVLRDKFPTVKKQIIKAPMLIYFKNGEAISVIDSSEKNISYKDLNNLIKTYSIDE